MSDSVLLLEGTFDSISLDDVFSVVGLSRQTVEVLLHDREGETSGRILIKAGRVLTAAAPPEVGREAFHRLYQTPGRAFSVWKRPHSEGASIGSLTELIVESQAFELHSTAPAPEPLLAGSFSEYQLGEVLDVLAVTRQLVELTARRNDGSSARMLVKADRLLACEDERGQRSGIEAFVSVYEDPGEQFEVARVEPSQPLPAALSRLSALVLQARAQKGAKVVEPTNREVILEGELEQTPLADVLASLSLSRLSVEILLRRSGRTRGTVLLKAGQVLSAQVLGSESPGTEAFFELLADPGDSFVVVRRSEGVEIAGLTVCGALRDLLVQARVRRNAREAPKNLAWLPRPKPAAGKPQPPQLSPPPVPQPRANKQPSPPKLAAAPARPPARPEKTDVILQGDFTRFSVQEVLSVLGLSRQYISLVTLRGNQPLGRLVVKSGRLLLASYESQRSPVAALAQLLRDPGTSFRVRRLRAYPGRELGPLNSTLAAARSLEAKTRPASLSVLPEVVAPDAETPEPLVVPEAPAPEPPVPASNEPARPPSSVQTSPVQSISTDEEATRMLRTLQDNVRALSGAVQTLSNMVSELEAPKKPAHDWVLRSLVAAQLIALLGAVGAWVLLN